MSHQPSALRARYVFPVCGPPIADGTIEIDGDHIAAVGGHLRPDRVDDLGNVAILPGLVNAHTHLEFAALSEPLGAPGMSLPEWIRLVLEHRRGASHADARAVSTGLRESLAAGTTALGDVATSDWRTSADLPRAMPATVLFHEFIGPSLVRAQAAVAAAEAFLEASSSASRILPALSPHAPYTVHPHLLAGLVELSQRYRVAMAMHLAESREELELLHLSSGPFRDLLEEVGAWEPSEDARLPYVVEYLAELAKAPRALVIHGNYLDGEEIEFLAAHRQTMSVVYCPRTHAYFGHDPYPLQQMLAAGVTMTLGTDSRASNPGLDMLAEIKTAAQAHRQVPAPTLLQMATLGGSKALGLDDEMGTLEPGKLANFAIVDLGGAGESTDPHELLLAPESRVVRTCASGRWVAAPPGGAGG
jgi:cytosine/adenosine deaminase-related metal-dependent hydrolase